MSSTAASELQRAFSDSFTALGMDRQRDQKVVVTSWPSVPAEIIRAAGLTPVIARGSSAATPDADEVLEPGVFPNRVRQLLQAALSGRLAHVAAIVLPRTSDADYKAYLYLQELQRRGRVPRLPPLLLFDLLQTQGPEIPAYNAARVRDLLSRLAQTSGRHVSTDALCEQIERANGARAAARRLATLRRDPVRVRGTEILPLLGARWTMAPERYTALADEAFALLAARPTLDGPRVMLTGMPVDSASLHLALESLNATIVHEISPFGAHEGRGSVDALTDPFAALGSWYASQLITARAAGAMLLQGVEESLAGIDLAVILLPPDDARFGWDVPRLSALLGTRGVGYAMVRSDPESGLSESDFAVVRAGLQRRSAPQAVQNG